MSNYPPGTYEGDPAAPWNRDDGIPLRATCGGCAHCIEPPESFGARGIGWCEWWGEFVHTEDKAVESGCEEWERI